MLKSLEEVLVCKRISCVLYIHLHLTSYWFSIVIVIIVATNKKITYSGRYSALLTEGQDDDEDKSTDDEDTSESDDDVPTCAMTFGSATTNHATISTISTASRSEISWADRSQHLTNRESTPYLGGARPKIKAEVCPYVCVCEFVQEWFLFIHVHCLQFYTSVLSLRFLIFKWHI